MVHQVFGLAKFKNTMLTRYGAATTLQSDVLKTKVQNTNIERYGNITPAANDLVKQKIAKTYKTRYGGIGFGSKTVRHKQQQTMLNKYGVMHSMQNTEISKKLNVNILITG